MSEDWEWETLETDAEIVDEEDLVVEEVEEEAELEEIVAIEPLEEDDLQMVAKPVVGNRSVGQTHHKFNLIRQEKPAGKRKYMGKAKSW